MSAETNPGARGEDGRLIATLDSIRIGIIAVDAVGRVEFQNAEASRILGISAKSSAGQPLADVLGVAHPAVTLLAEVLKTRRQVSSNGCSIRPRLMDEDELSVDIAASPISDEGGVEGVALTLRDHTIGRELEAIVDQRARNEVYAQLASGIAHEIRNPLGGIRGAAELLEGRLAEVASGADLGRYPRLIREETDRIRRLLDDFMELTRGGDLRPRLVNLHQILDRLLALQARSPGFSEIEVVREYDPSIPEIELDPDRITQVFLNLVRNAVEAMDGEGRLTLRTRVETPYHLSAGSTGAERMLRIEVEDSGPGIAEEDLPLVFTPFFTRRDGGTGLGLTLSQHWIVRHGGQIQVTRGHDGGTRVRVLLPVRRRE